MFNEWYLRDCSRKQLAAYQVRGRAGIPTTNDAVYGYKKDPEDKHHWLVDEEAAEVVRKIYRLAIEGYGPAQIACILRDSKIERPSHYLARQNRGAQRSCINEVRAYDWSPNTISKIIARPEYLGHTVNFRTYKDSYKDKKRKMRSEDERLVFENTHEAIIDRETWDLAQAARTVVRRTDTFGEPNPLTGLVYCADCGKRMYNHRSRGNKADLVADPQTGLYPVDRYECSTYNVNYYYSDNNCYSHSITSRALRSLVLETIQTVSQYAIENREEFIQRVRSASDLRHKEDAKELKRKVAKDQKRSAELDTLIKRLYESFALDKISEERFDMLLAGYENEQKELKACIAARQDELDTFEHDTAQIAQFLELTRKYTDFTELTTPMLREFVDKIVVHAPERDELGERYQAVDIYLKFIGKFDIPVQEPTPEELAEEEKARQRRAYNREKARESYERKKARKSAVTEATAEGAPDQGTHPDEKTA